MKREIIKIDDEKCNGCGLCIPNCHEGALQIIDGKARLVSELMCDGLGACIGHCPEGALEIEEREAEPYDEIKVIREMAVKGKNVVTAHLMHLSEHNETGYLKEALEYLRKNKNNIGFSVEKVIEKVCNKSKEDEGSIKNGVSGSGLREGNSNEHKGCPGSLSMSFGKTTSKADTGSVRPFPSALEQWPVQMHLINPAASHFKGSDMLLAADCTAFAAGDFHSLHLKSKSLAIACPKLDSNMDIYFEKLIDLIDKAKINTLTVMIMEVPCCGGLLQLARSAVQKASRKIPIKQVILGIRGNMLKEEWI